MLAVVRAGQIETQRVDPLSMMLVSEKGSLDGGTWSYRYELQHDSGR